MNINTMFITGIILVVLTAVISAVAVADVQVNYEDGSVLNVPRGWNVHVVPSGYNTKAFDWITNPTGQVGGKWPLFRPLCDMYYSGTEFGPYPEPYYACRNEPTLIVSGTGGPAYDFYDSDQDGVVDVGPLRDCSYDPYSPIVGREFDCEE